MENEEKENLETPEQDEAEKTENQDVDDTSDESQEEESQEDVSSLKKQIETLKKQKEHWRSKASAGGNKAEAPQEKPKATNTSSDELSQKDFLALARADVHEEDIDYVLKYAKLEGVGVKDALASDDLKLILKSKAEHRQTQAAANTKTARPSAKKISDRDILDKAKRGELPEPGTPEAEALFRARRNLAEDRRV